MRLPLGIAEKLLLLISGETIPASQLKHPVVDELLAEGILYKPGKLKSRIHLIDKQHLFLFLKNHFDIVDLEKYVFTLKKSQVIRSELIAVSSDSKLKAVRTFKGFLINSYSPVKARLNGEPIEILPVIGTFHFIYDFETFSPEPDVTIVGIENAENFRYIDRQAYLFPDIKPLFVSRYPQNQSKDLLTWLKMIPNKYLHFGDFDFAGLNIYFNEYKVHLGDRARFFIPDDIENILASKGNRRNYDNQSLHLEDERIDEPEVLYLIDLIHKYKKGLEQEVLLR